MNFLCTDWFLGLVQGTANVTGNIYTDKPTYEKTNNLDFPTGPILSCTSTEDGERLEILDLGSRETVLFV